VTAETVGSAQVTIDADFSTFDDQLRAGLTAAARRAGGEAEKILKRSGTNAGKEFSQGVAKAADSTKTIDKIQASLGRLEVAAKRAGDAQLDSAARVRSAEEALAKVKRTTSTVTLDGAAKIVAAEERVAKAHRDAARSGNLAQTAENALADARAKLANAMNGDGVADDFAQRFERKLKPAVAKAGNDSGGFFSRAFSTAASKSIGKGLFTGLIASLAGLITAASPLSTVLGGGTAAVIALAAALGQASGAALSLGGVLGSLGLAAIALKVGFSGVGDAVKAQAAAQAELVKTGTISAATQKKLDESLKGLAPSARSVVVELGKMTPAWNAVKRSVQQNLFAGVSTELANLGQRFLPILRQQLGTTATTLNQAFVGLSKFLTTGARSNQISVIFTGLNGILKTLLSPLKTLAGGFLDIFTASLPFAQQLATVLANVGTQFGTWLGKVADGDGFQKFMQTAMQTAGNLFQLLGNIGSIIGSVFAAGSATGGNLLQLLRDITGQFALFLKSSEGKAALASFFGLVAQAGGVLVGVFKTLSPLLSGIGSLFQALQGSLKVFGTALTGSIGLIATTLGGIFAQLGPVIGQLVVALAPIVTILGGVLAGALQALAPVVIAVVSALAQLLPVLTPLLGLLGTAFIGILQQLSGALLLIVPVLAQFIAAILTGLQPVIAALLPVFSQLVTAALGLIPPLLQILTSMLPLVPVGAQLSLAFAQLIVALAPLVTSILGSLASLLVQLAPVIAALVPIIARVIQMFVGMVQGVTGVVTAVVGFAVRVIAKFNEVRGAVIAAVSALVSRVVAFFAGLPGKINTLMIQFGDKVRGGIDKVGAFFQSLPGKITGVLSGLGGQLAQAGRNAMDGLIGGLEGALGRVREVAGNIAKAITGPVAKFLDMHSPSRVLKKMGNDAVQGIINGIKEKIPGVSAAMTILARAIPAKVEPAVNKLNTALNSLGKNLPSSIRTRLNQAVAVARVGIATIGRSQDVLNAKLKTAQDKLTSLLQSQQQLAQSVASSILQTGNIAAGQGVQTFKGIVDQLKGAVTQAKAFGTTIAALTKAGLNKTSLQQIIDAGPEAGLAAGQAVLSAGKAGVRQINTLQSQLQTAANKAATTAANAIFGQGVQIARGIVAGLQRQKSSLDAQMLRLADVLVARVLRVLRQVKLKGTGTLDIPGFRRGGIISQDSLVRAGEGGKREAIVPLERPRDRDRVMRQSGLDQVAAGKGSKTREVHVPIYAREASAAEVGKMVEDILKRYGFKPVLGLQTAGGVV
jgi:phage-related protein